MQITFIDEVFFLFFKSQTDVGKKSENISFCLTASAIYDFACLNAKMVISSYYIAAY